MAQEHQERTGSTPGEAQRRRQNMYNRPVPGAAPVQKRPPVQSGVPGYPRPPVQEDELIYRGPQSVRKKTPRKQTPPKQTPPAPKPRIPADGLLYSGPADRIPQPVRPPRVQPKPPEPPKPPKPRYPDDGLLYHAPVMPEQPIQNPIFPLQEPMRPMQQPVPPRHREPVPVRERPARQETAPARPEPPRQEPPRRAKPAPRPEKMPVPERRTRSGAAGTPPSRRPPRDSRPVEEEVPKQPLWKKLLVAALIVLLLVGGALALAGNYVLSKFGSFDETLPLGAGQISAGATAPSDPLVPELSIDNAVNIMLIGADASPDGVRSRSDTMILVTLNPGRNAIQMTSFMRDTYVHIPGYQDNRLNVAYRYGDIELMNETIRQNFGVTVDGNVLVDFSKFAEIIDLLGGVDIELSREEANYMIKEGCILEPGVNHLNGADALTFVRMRYVSGGDYGRTERQRRVLTQLIATFRNADLRTIMRLTDEILPSITTNVPKLDIIKYVTNGLALLSQDASIETLQIPANDAHRAAMISEMSVLVPDLEMCREDLEEFFAPTAPAESTATTSE